MTGSSCWVKILPSMAARIKCQKAYLNFWRTADHGCSHVDSLIVGAGIGSALIGLRPIVELMYIDFATLASDQIINQAAKFHFMTGGNVTVPMVIRTQQGAGRSAAAQHSQSLESWYAHIPGLKVVLPTTV